MPEFNGIVSISAFMPFKIQLLSLFLMIWRCNCKCILHYWNDSVESHFVFNELSGQTHVLNGLAMYMLELLRYQSISEKEIFNKLACLYEGFDLADAETEQHVIDILTSLDDLGLIEPCST